MAEAMPFPITLSSQLSGADWFGTKNRLPSARTPHTSCTHSNCHFSPWSSRRR